MEEAWISDIVMKRHQPQVPTSGLFLLYEKITYIPLSLKYYLLELQLVAAVILPDI